MENCDQCDSTDLISLRPAHGSKTPHAVRWCRACGSLYAWDGEWEWLVPRSIVKAKEIVEAVEADERHHYKPAAVQVNAPLALVQVALKEMKATALRILSPAKES